MDINQGHDYSKTQYRAIQLCILPGKPKWFSQNSKRGAKKPKHLHKDVTFDIQSSFYINDSFFVFQNRNELHNAVGALNNPFLRFGLKMDL